MEHSISGQGPEQPASGHNVRELKVGARLRQKFNPDTETFVVVEMEGRIRRGIAKVAPVIVEHWVEKGGHNPHISVMPLHPEKDEIVPIQVRVRKILGFGKSPEESDHPAGPPYRVH